MVSGNRAEPPDTGGIQFNVLPEPEPVDPTAAPGLSRKVDETFGPDGALAGSLPSFEARDGQREMAISIAEAFEERASRGISILTFPEAHRSLDGKVGTFKRGVFNISVKCGLPIAPLLGEAIKRIADESSVSSLFD